MNRPYKTKPKKFFSNVVFWLARQQNPIRMYIYSKTSSDVANNFCTLQLSRSIWRPYRYLMTVRYGYLSFRWKYFSIVLKERTKKPFDRDGSLQRLDGIIRKDGKWCKELASVFRKFKSLKLGRQRTGCLCDVM